jgi:hypothetical protein
MAHLERLGLVTAALSPARLGRHRLLPEHLGEEVIR